MVSVLHFMYHGTGKTGFIFNTCDITFITLLMSGTAGYTFINIQAFKVNNWFINVDVDVDVG